MGHTVKIEQWKVIAGGETRYLFASSASKKLEVMAMAVSLYGANVSSLTNEGLIRVALTNQHLAIADKRYCAECGDWISQVFPDQSHDETCSKFRPSGGESNA